MSGYVPRLFELDLGERRAVIREPGIGDLVTVEVHNTQRMLRRCLQSVDGLTVDMTQPDTPWPLTPPEYMTAIFALQTLLAPPEGIVVETERIAARVTLPDGVAVHIVRPTVEDMLQATSSKPGSPGNFELLIRRTRGEDGKPFRLSTWPFGPGESIALHNALMDLLSDPAEVVAKRVGTMRAIERPASA